MCTSAPQQCSCMSVTPCLWYQHFTWPGLDLFIYIIILIHLTWTCVWTSTFVTQNSQNSASCVNNVSNIKSVRSEVPEDQTILIHHHSLAVRWLLCPPRGHCHCTVSLIDVFSAKSTQEQVNTPVPVQTSLMSWLSWAWNLIIQINVNVFRERSVIYSSQRRTQERNAKYAKPNSHRFFSCYTLIHTLMDEFPNVFFFPCLCLFGCSTFSPWVQYRPMVLQFSNIPEGGTVVAAVKCCILKADKYRSNITIIWYVFVCEMAQW